jgi:hypothetical protein
LTGTTSKLPRSVTNTACCLHMHSACTTEEQANHKPGPQSQAHLASLSLHGEPTKDGCRVT